MTALRLLLASVLLAATAIACSGRNEPPPAAAPQVAPPDVVAPPDDVAAVSSTLTEEKLKRLLAFEEEILPITAELVALSTMPAVTGGAEARRASGQPTREERARTLEAGIAAALQKHRLTPSDHAGFAGLTGSLVEGDAKVARAREVLALNEKKKVAWARIEAEDRKKKRDPRTPPASVTRGRRAAAPGDCRAAPAQADRGGRRGPKGVRGEVRAGSRGAAGALPRPDPDAPGEAGEGGAGVRAVNRRRGAA